MPDPQNTKSGKRGGSLLSLGGGTRREVPAPSGSLLSSAARETERDQASHRHRLARSRREARPNPLLHALAARPDPADGHDDDIDADFIAGLDAEMRENEERLRRRRRRRAPRREASNAMDDDRDERDDWGATDEDEAPARPAPDPGPRPLIDPLNVINGVWNSKKLIAATTIAGALIGVMVALATPKKYEAVGEVLVDPRDIRLVDRDLIRADFSPNTAIAIVENQVRIMGSSRVLTAVVNRLNLDADPEFNGTGGGFGLPNIIGELRSLLARKDGVAPAERQHAIATQNLAERLEIGRSGKTFVVLVAVKTESPEKSALITNTVIDVFMENSGQLMSTAASRAASELGAKLDELRAGVQEAERKVEAFKGEKDLIDARGHLIGDDEIIKLNDQLATARANTIELSAKAASARDLDVDSALGGALPEGISSGLIAELRSQYAELMRQANEAAVKYGSKHPKSQLVRAQIDGAREQLRTELRRIAASLQVEVKRAVELEQNLSARLAALKARQVNISDDMVTLRELERDSASKRAIYESFLLRAREAGEQTDLNNANISVITTAAAPLDPVGPSRTMISIGATMAGFLLGVALGGMRGAAEGLFGGAPAAPPGAPKPREPAHRDRESRSARSYRRDSRHDDATRQGTATVETTAAHAGDSVDAKAHRPTEPAPAYAAAPPQPFPAWPQPVAYAPQPVYYPYPAPYPPAPMAVYAPPAYPPTGFAPPFFSQAAMAPWPPPATAYPAAPPAPQPSEPPRAGETERKANDTNPSPAGRKTGSSVSPVDTIRDDLRAVTGALYDLADRRARRRA
ncbi:MAG: GumC family protein [Rhizobiaceae bacterium]